MHPPETPIPPWASRSLREMPPPLLSPSFSRRLSPPTAASVPAVAAADGDNGGAVSEHPYIELYDWWLASVEGDDQKFFVAGVYERNQTVLKLAPTPIAKRHKYNILETEDRVVLHICGSLNLSRMRGNGYTSTACENFMIGFPYWWDTCNHRSLKETKSQTGCPSSSSFEKDKQFYLEKFQLGERLHSAFMSEWSTKDAALKKSSHLPNGAPRFEEYTCDGGILTNENSAASNGEGERHEAVCNEVDNAERYLTAGRALGEGDGGDIENNASLLLTVECANDNGNEEANNAPPTSTCDERAQVAPLTRFQEYTCDGDIATKEKAACSNDSGKKDEAVCDEVNDVQIDLIGGRALRERNDGGIETNASLVLTVECANDVGNEKADNARPTGDQGTAVVSLKTKGFQEKKRLMAFSEKAVIDEEMPTSVCINVQNSSYLSNEIPRFEKKTCLGDIPANEDAAALNDNSERCTAVSEELNSMEIGLTVGSAINVSLDRKVECTNAAVNEGVDNTSLVGCKKTPVASLKSQGCREKLQIPSNEKPSAPKKQRSELEKLQGPTRSPFTSPVLYAHDSPLTRCKATSLSMSTPEALKLRKTRSGRVIVPALDAGCQRIVYDMDGMITGVIGLDPPSPKGSNLRTYATKKRRAEPAAASKLKTYTRKKRKAEQAAVGKLKTYARRKKTRAE